jgi:hypothetical protein
MADVAMEREGKAAGGRAVQRKLILWCVRWDFGGIFVHLPHLAPTIPPKNTLAEEGYLLYVRRSPYKKKTVSVVKTSHHEEFRGK